MAWRFVVLTTAGATKGWTVDSVERLRAAQRWAQLAYARHEVDDWLWFSVPLQPANSACPRCGRGYVPGRSRVERCRCGLTHDVYDCATCSPRVEPPYGDGCGPIPFDPAAHRPSRRLRHRPR